MQESKAYFDDRLYTHGIDYVAWDNAGPSDHQPRTVTLSFQVENVEPVNIAERVMPNATDTEYQAITVNESLEKRGVRDIRVEVSRGRFVQSIFT